VTELEKGAGAARNAGAAAASAEWFAFLDSDCVPEQNWLATARAIADKKTVFGGRVSLFDETPPPRTGAQVFEAVFAFRTEAYLKKGFLPSCQLVMAASSFASVGGFETGVSEDVVWSRRAREAGLRLALSPELVISHPTRSNWKALSRKWRRLTSEGFRTKERGLTGRLSWAARALLMPASAFVHAPRIIVFPNLSWSEKLQGLAVLFGLRLRRMVWMVGQALTGRA